ncbi:MAG TPA: protein-glutamate O-methyltransferase CheR [Thiotrichales bacterium]|nr:protein-glutamate O-methyltransferase CheR [Thiotrichales bacterium]
MAARPETGSPFIPLPEMSGRQFREWAELFERRAGLVISPERKSFLVTAVGLRMREAGFDDYEAYYQWLHRGRESLPEWSLLLDRVTVHETRFFRHPRALELVSRHVSDKPCEGEALSYQVWSIGCATGEEAYSLAMVVDQALLARSGRSYFGVVASDISVPSLTVAREGIYKESRLDELDDRLLRHYFAPLEDGRFRVVESLRRRVCFAQMNIFDHARHPLGPMDVIYCQNVLIYFQRERRKMLLDGLVEYLLPGGLLILGSGDVVGWNHPRMERVRWDGVLAYRRLPPQGRTT